MAKRYVDLTEQGSEKDKERLLAEYSDNVCNYGVYIGHNTMGKILTLIRDCILDGTEPDIDYKLLNRKEIYLLGKRLKFMSLL